MSMMSTVIDAPQGKKSAVAWIEKTPVGLVPSQFEGTSLEVISRVGEIYASEQYVHGSLRLFHYTGGAVREFKGVV